MKSCLPSVVHGAYTFVSNQTALEYVEANSTVITNSFWKITCPVNLELFQTMIVPPELPTDGM
jgi:hypothetical protein